jgi:molecular chaperone DnaK (HSP70)
LPEPRFIVGIDLGTTNSVVAYAPVSQAPGLPPDIRILQIPQLVAPGTVLGQPALPSFLFLPGPHDVPKGALALPWDPDAAMAVGVFARDRGAELPARLVSSAKSWLCHGGVDRNAPLLPWEAPEDTAKLSPVEAQAAILAHIRRAWDHLMAQNAPEAALEHQEVLLTVPASFDAVARELTVKAASMAGIPGVTLLEEPQAAFYAWIHASGDAWREHISAGGRVLVCDVGGGTTDFSLIEAADNAGALELRRVAVGDHLLVGGDNMDLALAHHAAAKHKAAGGKKLDSWQMRALWQACRAAKEKLFAENGPDKTALTVLGRGASLIGGTVTIELTRAEAETFLAEGFFPLCDKNAAPSEQARAGMRELGLPYASDPAVTRHLAHFLHRADRSRTPGAVLFNGGVMKAAPLRDRVTRLLDSWAGGDAPAQALAGGDCDLAVARGAAYYGFARRGRGVRIRGGLNKSYYIGVEASLPAVPGLPVPMVAVCLAPFGMEEGTETDLPGREFGLVVGEQTRFDLLASSSRTGDAPGSVIEDWEDDIAPAAAIETLLPAEPGQEGSVVPVRLHAKATLVGTLEISCVTRDGEQSHKLEFNVREKTARGPA